MFDTKKEADAHDKMLELAENFGWFLEKQIEGITEQDAEKIGLLLSKNKDLLVAACRGKPEFLLDIGKDSSPEESNITPMKANA